MKALILAAGMGSRLWPLTRNTPKSLLDLGHGLTLIELQMEALRECGVRDVVLVTGYCSDQVEAKLKVYHDVNIQIVYNPFYDISNNLVSAWLALPYLPEDFVLINGDDIFKTDLIRNLVHAKGEIVMAISRKEHYDSDDMKVETRGDRVLKVAKTLPLEIVNGESVGIMRFSRAGARWFEEELDQILRQQGGRDVFYLQALANIMIKGLPVNYLEVDSSEWAEVDFHPDLETVKSYLTEKISSMRIEDFTTAKKM